jgi:hypothetical protein
MKEVQEKLLPGELGVSPRILLLISPQDWGTKGVESTESSGGGSPNTRLCPACPFQPQMIIGAPICSSQG